MIRNIAALGIGATYASEFTQGDDVALALELVSRRREIGNGVRQAELIAGHRHVHFSP